MNEQFAKIYTKEAVTCDILLSAFEIETHGINILVWVWWGTYWRPKREIDHHKLMDFPTHIYKKILIWDSFGIFIYHKPHHIFVFNNLVKYLYRIIKYSWLFLSTCDLVLTICLANSKLLPGKIYLFEWAVLKILNMDIVHLLLFLL